MRSRADLARVAIGEAAAKHRTKAAELEVLRAASTSKRVTSKPRSEPAPTTTPKIVLERVLGPVRERMRAAGPSTS